MLSLTSLSVLLLSPPRITLPAVSSSAAEIRPTGDGVRQASLGDAIGAPPARPSDKHDRPARFTGEPSLVESLEREEARPLALASADFDEDGVPDLVGGYAHAGGGILSLNRGNVDSVYPNAPEARQRRASGSSTDAPFLSPARVFGAGVTPDFIGAGDFDADGHCDVVAAGRGEKDLYWHAGDGHGGLGKGRRIELGGAVTALAVGEVNRADGLNDVIVGVAGDSGARLLVFEGPDGALRSTPEVFSLPAPVTSLAPGQFDNHYTRDLAAASGNELLIFHGRDRKLSQDREAQATVKAATVSRRRFDAAIKSLAVGNFIAGQQTDIALLDEAGAVRVLSREGESGELGRGSDGRAEGRALSDWFGETEAVGAARPSRLYSAFMSGSPNDDLMFVDSAGEQLRLLNGGAGRDGLDDVGDSLQSGGPVMIAAQDELVAVLPLRLDADALSDLVVLSKGRAAPEVALTQRPVSSGRADVRHARQLLQSAGAAACARTPISIGQTVSGELTISDCRFTDGSILDAYSFSGQAGQYVSITMSSDTFDTYVDLLASDGLLMAFDGFAEPKRTSRIIFGLPADGTYDIRVSSFAPDTTGSYTLALAHVPTAPQTFTVVNTNDSGPGSLRQVLLDANAHPGADTIVFNIGSGPQTIAAAPPLPEITDAVTIDATTQPGFAGKPIIELTGVGFFITGGRSVVRGMVFNRSASIIIFRNRGNIVEGNFVGTDLTGTVYLKSPSLQNIDVLSANNKIGGTVAAARNVISGAFFVGGHPGIVENGNVVQGNFIGTDVTGTTTLTGSAAGDFGFGLDVQSMDNFIGGTTAGAGNLISGNKENGLTIVPTFTDESGGNLVQGNLIGTDVTGTKALPNASAIPNSSFFGMTTSGPENTIGGTTPAARNVISGNTGLAGIGVGGREETGSLVQGNFIGTDITGLRALGNSGEGVSISLGNGNTVGGAVAGARNVIAGNGGTGVSIRGFSFPGGGGTAANNKIQGNFIGTDATGSRPLGNRGHGVQITISGSVANNAVGGATPGTGNVISGNQLNGVAMGIKFNQDEREFSGGTGILVQGNFIGTDAAGAGPLGNGLNGVFVDADSFTNTVANNTLAHNGLNGVFIPANSNPGVKIFIDDNAVFNNRLLGIDLGNAGITPNDPGDPDGGANLQQNFPTLISAAAGGAGTALREGGRERFGTLTVSGTLNSAPNTAYTIHWYFSNAAQCIDNQTPSRPLVTGRLANVTTDAAGNAAFNFPFTFPAGVSVGVINCTATDQQGNTSEFSSCQSVNDPTAGPSVQLAAANFTTAEGANSVSVTVTRAGATSSAATVNYVTTGGTASERSDYTASVGTLRFAPGETTKSVPVIVADDVFVEGSESFTITLSDPGGAALGSPAAAVVTIADNDAITNPANPLDSAQFFARQHYADFLNREPDAGGLQFWTENITSCGADAQCVEVKRVNVSAAFYLSIEFQETGYLVYRAHKAAFGDLAGKPVPVRLRDFLTDTRQLGEGVVVGTPGWPEKLEVNKAAYFTEFVTRPAFVALYPPSLTAAEFADRLFAKAAITPLPAERQAAVAAFGAGGTAGRAAALRSVAESQTLKTAETNKAFVLMQYFGYLRRNPDDPQDTNFDGYHFWLSKLNQFNGDFVKAEMVRAFISSIEYRQRFGQ